MSHQQSDEEDGSEEEQEEQCLQLVVRQAGKPENESLEILLDADATVLDLKQSILEEMTTTDKGDAEENDDDDDDDDAVVPVERQRLIFSGKMLRDDTQQLMKDLSIKPGQKHFVHLSPLPKGAKVSRRTQRELLSVDNHTPTTSLTTRQEQPRTGAQGARSVGSRQRRRRRAEDPAASGAFHPYALAVPLRAAANESASADATRSLMDAVAASEQRAQQIAITESLLASQEQAAVVAAAASASERLGGIGVLGNSYSLCPFAAPAGLGDNTSTSALSLLASSRHQPLRSLLPHHLLESAGFNHHSLLLQGSAVASLESSSEAVQVRLLQDILALPDISATSQEGLPDVLDQLAHNAGELAATLRILSPPATTTTTTTAASLYSPTAASTSTSTSTPLSISLEERLNATMTAREQLQEALLTREGNSPFYHHHYSSSAPGNTAQYPYGPSGFSPF